MFPEEFGLVKDPIKSFIVDKPSRAWKSASSREEERARRFEELAYELGLKHLLDLPLVALSNGQTRRARIVKALLAQPELLLLDEPLSV
jgi:ABC-type molybdenum transport system ATPase subunit/photorepair protein PhrA